MCIDNAFVALKQELGKDGKSITSQWRDTRAQRRALRISDRKRKDFYAAQNKGQQPRPRKPTLQDQLDKAHELLEEYRSDHDHCNDETLGSTAPQASDRRCSICKAVDELE